MINYTSTKEELMKIAKELTEEARSHISKKNFALTQGQSSTGKPAYPIEDKAHARAALGFVGMHGSAKEKSEVYKDVAKKYPELAEHSKIPALRKKAAAAPKSILGTVAHNIHKYEDPIEVAGLGILGGIGADRLQAHARAGAGASEHDIEKKQLMGESGHAAVDSLGLGVLAAPLVAKRVATGKWTGH